MVGKAVSAVRKARTKRARVAAAALLLVPACGSVSPALVGAEHAQAASAPQTSPSEEVRFTAREAGGLLDQIGAGLVGHNRKKMLAAFDLARMADGRLFEQQITSFLAHTGIIRVHYNRMESGMEEGNSVAAVDFEMEAEPLDDSLPPVRKQARLRLVAQNTAAGWKLIDVQPRAFFSLSQP
jgi:hypothetical protein